MRSGALRDRPRRTQADPRARPAPSQPAALHRRESRYDAAEYRWARVAHLRQAQRLPELERDPQMAVVDRVERFRRKRPMGRLSYTPSGRAQDEKPTPGGRQAHRSAASSASSSQASPCIRPFAMASARAARATSCVKGRRGARLRACARVACCLGPPNARPSCAPLAADPQSLQRTHHGPQHQRQQMLLAFETAQHAQRPSAFAGDQCLGELAHIKAGAVRAAGP